MTTRYPYQSPTKLWSILHSQSPNKVWILLCCATITSIWKIVYTTPSLYDVWQQLWVEWLSWILLFAAALITSRSWVPQLDFTTAVRQWHPHPVSWLLGIALVSSQLLLSTQKVQSWMLPLTTFAVSCTSSCARRQIKLELQDKEAFLNLQPASYLTETIYETVHSPTVLILNLLLAIPLFLNSGSSSLILLVYGLCFLVLRVITLAGIARIQEAGNSLRGPSEPQAKSGNSFLLYTTFPLAVFLTLLLLLTRPILTIGGKRLLLSASIQAIWWYALARTVEIGLPVSAANLDTVVLGMTLALQSSNLHNLVAGLSIVLISVINGALVLRNNVRARQIITILVSLFLLFTAWHLLNVSAIENGGNGSETGGSVQGHPIENLVSEKRKYFQRLQAKQSKTVEEAVQEYQRRYQRRPPLGFDRWFELARKHNFVLPDEFDTFMKSLEPFNGIHPSILQQRMDKLWSLDGITKAQVARIEYLNGKITIRDQDNVAKNVLQMLAAQEFADAVPYNFSMLMNTWDEPMISTPWDEVDKAMKDARDPKSQRFASDGGQVEYYAPFVEASGGDGWTPSRHGCPADSPARQSTCVGRVYNETVEFISNVSSSTDVCQHCELRNQHGLLISPQSLHIFNELIPVWSTSKPSHFNDILSPSYWYINQDNYEPETDRKWKNKDNIFHWVGSSTGGRATPENWADLQRQRLVLSTSFRPDDPIQLLQEVSPNQWSPFSTSMQEVEHLFSTRISRVVQCELDACPFQEIAFGSEEAGLEHKGAAYAHRFIIDIDGNGFSGRFYRLLRSNSVTVKSTILREWHDDRLIPWVHYIPLSMNFHELPEMARFLASTTKGLEISERIARESSEWHDRSLRQVDLQLSFLRMVLEYGRVMDPGLTY